MAYAEKRRFIRHIFDNPLEYQATEGGPFRRTKTVDASEGGLMFLSESEFASDTVITLQMPLDDELFKIQAKVVRVIKDEDTGKYRIGVAFMDYDDAFLGSLKLKLVNVLLVMSFFSTMFSSVPQAHAATEELHMPQKVMLSSTFENDWFTSKYSDEFLRDLVAKGCQYLSIGVAQYQNHHSSTEIKSTYMTPGDKSVMNVIKRAHDLGLKVILKPHIDLIDKFDGMYNRSDIGFSSEDEWQKWFDAYKGFITRYAAIAEKAGVDILCVGAELTFTTEREDKWREVIAAVRQEFTGKITYVAARDNFRRIGFWDAVDFAGIAADMPTVPGTVPRLEDLRSGWENWYPAVEAWQAIAKKPVMFTNKLL